MMGIGQGVFVPLAIAYLVDGASAENQSKSLGIFVSGASLGRSTALLAVGSLLVLLEPLASQSDVAVWRWLFVLTGIPNVIAAAVLLSKRPSAPVPARAKPHPRLR
jgi:MFS family permease